ncbi:hypothetical protein BaRGS_00024554, partial [Batillaria attramentaria]
MFAIFHRLYWGILLLPSLYAETNCASFHFPTLNGTKVTVQENVTLTIPFRVEGCALANVTKIYVKIDETYEQCIIRFINNNWRIPSNHHCQHTGNNSFKLEHKFTRTDSALWTWSADKTVNKSQLFFFVQ